MTASQQPASWYERVPKIELHLHLEGAIPHDALWQLMQKYGGDSVAVDLASLKTKFVYRDFAHFIETWVWQAQYLREYDDFVLIAEAVAQNLSRQNIRYVESFYSPSDFERHGLTIPQITEAIRSGLSRIPGVEIALVADLIRDAGQQKAASRLAQVNEVKDLGVIGIGIGGSEQLFPPEPFEPVYEEARRLGFHTSAHAGEAAGAASIWGAIRSLRVDRIGHGTRAVEDASLLSYLAEQRIPIELCPISNVRTGVIPAITDHPARRYYELGLRLSINTDDPAMFGNSLAEEYRVLEEQLGFSRDDIRALILQAVDSSWLPLERKIALAGDLAANPNWLD
jgi:adenosine deaminase